MSTLHLYPSATLRLPRDVFGRRSSPSGRALLLDAARRVAGLTTPPVRGTDRRWHWPDGNRQDGDWRGSVSHVGEFALAGLTRGVWIGVDIQDQRPRPAAIGWLARVLDQPVEQVTMRHWAETEALLKAQGIAGIRPTHVTLPPWQPGWRPTGDGWWLHSSPAAPGGIYLALAARAPLALQWEADPGPLTSYRALRPRLTEGSLV
ncbi:hypothetical protein P3T37_004743 [Kitasatospora sp. MAA4]|uniref:hypothetical protein n=1 Tax=Kitasatospora sp. MAA4 TaxID=3035093 RepID=UPI00247422C4|nr:hypothetical protein [Kitasatospora sp. MAA4]MDH6135328.1 hypothetical protein [Kitasatospora sp. MAA4]